MLLHNDEIISNVEIFFKKSLRTGQAAKKLFILMQSLSRTFFINSVNQCGHLNQALTQSRKSIDEVHKV